MNLEQQYRTGRFPQEDPVPEWLKDRVTDIVMDIMDSVDIRGRMRPLLEAQCTPSAQADAAKRTLGIDGPLPVNLLAHTQHLVDTDPLHAAEYWEAMWTVRARQSAADEYRMYLPAFARMLDTWMLYRELGWPEGWHPDLCDLWQECGGTPATARAWARRGWNAEHALAARTPGKGHPMTLRERVTCLTPPVFVPAAGCGTNSDSNVRSMMTSGGTR